MKSLRSAAIAFAAVLLLPTVAAAQVRVQVGHVAPFADTLAGTSVTVRINGAAAIENFRFGDVTPGYVNLGPPGTYRIDIVPTGTQTVAITATVELGLGEYTVLAIGNGAQQPLALLAVPDENSVPPAGEAKLRVIHAAPFGATAAATSVAVRTDEGALVGGLNPVPYRAVSPFLRVPAGSVDVKVTSTDGNTNLIDLAPVALASGSITTVVAVGDGVRQPLGFVALPGGRLVTETPVGDRGVGFWYDPAIDGQGFTFFTVPRENRIVGHWATYAPTGGQQRWYTLESNVILGGNPQSGFDGRIANLTVFATSGGQLGIPGGVQVTPVGRATLTVDSCGAAVLDWTIGANTGRYLLTNLTPLNSCR